MFHTVVYDIFKDIFPEVAANSREWFPNGKNSVRVRSNNGSDFVFTYHGKDNWCYETVESYINKLRGGHKMNVGLYDNSNKDEQKFG